VIDKVLNFFIFQNGLAYSLQWKIFQKQIPGSNKENQLGLGDDAEETVCVPTRLPFHETVTNISCGYYHSALVTAEGNVYTFGEADGGKLGVEGTTVDFPTKVDVPEKVSHSQCDQIGRNFPQKFAQISDFFDFI